MTTGIIAKALTARGSVHLNDGIHIFESGIGDQDIPVEITVRTRLGDTVQFGDILWKVEFL